MEPQSRGLVAYGKRHHNKTIEKHTLERTRERRNSALKLRCLNLALNRQCSK